MEVLKLRTGLLLLCLYGTAPGAVESQLNEDMKTSASALLVEKLIRAYNTQNTDAFVPLFTEDVEFYKFPGILMFKGKDELIKRYGLMFKKLKCAKSSPIKRIVQGDYVIDHEINESCSEHRGVVDKRSEIITSYQIINGKIARVLFFLPPEGTNQ